MRLWAAALLIVLAGSSACKVADADSKPDSTAAWSLVAKPDGGFINAIRLTTDGDLVVAGNFRGPFGLGDAKPLDSKYQSAFVGRLTSTGTVRWLRAIDRDSKYAMYSVSGLALGADGSILVDVFSDDDSKLSRVVVSADGTAQTPNLLLEAKGYPSTSIVGTDSIVMGARLTKSKCKGNGLPVYRVNANGKIVWSACNPTKTEINQAHHVASVADGRSAVCEGRAVMAFTAKGKRTLNEMHDGGDDPDVTCEGVSIGETGQVAALRDGVEKTMVLATWSSNGTAGWKKLCTDLMKGHDRCVLTTVTAAGMDLLVGVMYGDKSSIIRLDAKTGDVKASYPFGLMSFETFAATETGVYYASNEIALGHVE